MEDYAAMERWKNYMKNGVISIRLKGLYSGRSLISAPSVKNAILNGCSSGTYQHFDKPFFILSSMGPTYIDKIFSFLRQIVF